MKYCLVYVYFYQKFTGQINIRGPTENTARF